LRQTFKDVEVPIRKGAIPPDDYDDEQLDKQVFAASKATDILLSEDKSDAEIMRQLMRRFHISGNACKHLISRARWLEFVFWPSVRNAWKRNPRIQPENVDDIIPSDSERSEWKDDGRLGETARERDCD
jgi:hypothetical protein